MIRTNKPAMAGTKYVSATETEVDVVAVELGAGAVFTAKLVSAEEA